MPFIGLSFLDVYGFRISSADLTLLLAGGLSAIYYCIMVFIMRVLFPGCESDVKLKQKIIFVKVIRMVEI
jgi:hypothetical protein